MGTKFLKEYMGKLSGSTKTYFLLILLLLLVQTITVMAQSKKTAGKAAAADTIAFTSGKYRNLFLEAGYSQADIDNKIEKAYSDIFEGPNRVYFEVGDSMAYVSDLKNHDARTEGLSYGMMVTVQLNKKDVFDRIWRWSKKYLQHQSGPREGYFAWSYPC